MSNYSHYERDIAGELEILTGEFHEICQLLGCIFFLKTAQNGQGKAKVLLNGSGLEIWASYNEFYFNETKHSTEPVPAKT